MIKVLWHHPGGPLRYSTENFFDDSGNWAGKIASITNLERAMGDEKSYEVSSVTITLDDTDRFFRNMMDSENQYFAGSVVEFFNQSDELLYTGKVEKWSFHEGSIEIYVNDQLSGLNTKIAGRVLYGILAASQKGKIKCGKVEPYKYFIADHHVHSLDDTYLGDGVPVFATLDNNSDGNSYVNCDNTEEDYIYANVKGKKAGSGEVLTAPIDIIKDFIDSYTPLGYSTQTMVLADQIMQNRGYKMAAEIHDLTVHEVLEHFCFSFDCDFFLSNRNELVVKILDWSTLSPVKKLEKSQIDDFSLDVHPEEVRNRVKYMYDYNFGHDDYFHSLPIYEDTASIGNWGEYYSPLDLRYVTDWATAFDVVQRYVIQHKNPARRARVSIPLNEYGATEMGAIISISHPNAIEPGERKYQVIRISISFQEKKVDLECFDISTLGGGIFILGDRLSLPASWPEASTDDRNYGYLADRTDSYFNNNMDYGKVLY